MPKRELAKLRQIQHPLFYSRATLILKCAHDSASSLLDTFHLLRKEKGGTRRGMTTDEEQDLLRAMLVMAAAGLDAMVKQLIRDSLPPLVACDPGVKEGLEKFISRQIRGEGESSAAPGGKEFLARVLAAPSQQAQVIEEYINDLTQGSLQSPAELCRIAAAFGLQPQILGVDQKVLKTIFGIRNEIIHELDINLGAERRRRNLRKSGDMISHTNALLQVAENLRDAAERKLATSASLPTSKPAPKAKPKAVAAAPAKPAALHA